MPKFKQLAQQETPGKFRAAFGPAGRARKDAFAANPIEFSDHQDFVEWYGMSSMMCFHCHNPIENKGELDVQIAEDGSTAGRIYTFHKDCEKKPWERPLGVRYEAGEVPEEHEHD